MIFWKKSITESARLLGCLNYWRAIVIDKNYCNLSLEETGCIILPAVSSLLYHWLKLFDICDNRIAWQQDLHEVNKIWFLILFH